MSEKIDLIHWLRMNSRPDNKGYNAGKKYR